MARQSVMSIRRIGTALALAALLGAGGMAAVGTAAADAPEFILAARHAGDRVAYASSLDTEEWPAFGTLEQLQLFPWKDGEGTYHLVDGIREDVPLDDTTLAAYSYLDLDGQPLAATRALSLATGSSQGLLSTEAAQSQASRLVLGATGHPCGFVNSLQGSSGDRFTALCPEAADAVFRLTGSAAWNGGEAAVFSAGNATLWFQPDVPYPVRIEVGEIWHEMTGFTRGSALLEAVPLPDDTPLPVVTPAPRPEHGADFSGIAMRYPIERAIDEAIADPAFPDLRDFLATHPEAQIVAAEHIRDPDQETWMIVWADDRETLRFTAEHRRMGAASALHEATGLDPQEAWATDRSGWVQAHGSSVPPPPSAPPLRQVAGAWQVYAESDGPPRVVGFVWPDCICPLNVYAGSLGTLTSTRSDVWGIGRPPSETDESGHTLHYGDDGRLLAILMTQRVVSRGDGSLPSPEAAAVVGTLGGPQKWSAPDAQAAAGIGLGALLIGAVYWAWPLAQSLPVVGLRWRRRRALLDHPVRRRLHDAVAAKPGIHYHEIVRETGLGKGAIEHHLRRLVDGGALQCVRNDGYTCYFPSGTDHRAAAAAGALKSVGAQQVLDAVRSHPGAAVTDIARLTGLSPGTVSHHLRRLRQRGVIESWRDGRTVRLRTGSIVALLP